MDNACQICSNRNRNKRILVREMMFGLREEFDYLECAGCGCVQLLEPPGDLNRYYPDAYYPARRFENPGNGLKQRMREARAHYCLHGKGLAGRLATSLLGRPRCRIFGNPDYYEWLQRCGVTFRSRIADVGCGSALLLQRLHLDGFQNLTGIDPFVEPYQSGDKRFRIIKAQIYDVEETFDLVMLHHTFEHLPEPRRVLQHLHRLMHPGSHLLIRIPVASSFAYRNYGSNWAQIDAPRHLFLHTVKSMQLLAQESGLVLKHTVFDSTEFQFWASEQYIKDIPLHDERSFSRHPEASLFSAPDIERFKRRAEELNLNREGDSACFYLYKTKP